MLAADIVKLFKENHLTLGSIESFTGGRFSANITSVPGASAVFKGAIVTYASEEKINLLAIPESVVSEYGVVSKEVAFLMAERGMKVLNVDVCVSFTGNAGPTAMENKPVGETYFAISYKNITNVYKFDLSGLRQEIQEKAIEKAYLEIEKFLKKISVLASK